MSAKTDQFELDLVNIEGDIQPDETAATMELNGNTYPVRAGLRIESDDYEEGGKAVRIEQNIWVRRSLFTDGRIPKTGRPLTFEGKEMRIEEVAPTPDQIDFRILVSYERI